MNGFRLDEVFVSSNSNLNKDFLFLQKIMNGNSMKASMKTRLIV